MPFVAPLLSLEDRRRKQENIVLPSHATTTWSSRVLRETKSTRDVASLSLLIAENRLRDTMILRAVVGCSTLDHQTCDELCKQDNYWYGHCTAWDGRDFQCRCYEYKSPADGSLCANQQRYCMDLCQRKGAEGGYCYPQPSAKSPRGTPKCQCFKALPDPN
ncbi:hypothetical protein QR680_001159 [Steinernema hermaphroditum]|uniref:Knottin scorpion toxin-like domain-containing protein n=1 Tax=Steinernema hermaphroditum TaxID=289476 RepID=A0AA39GX52_9BILA|nr:hypothetical protein QR680_001159 [Steinernema hermaphroditum]